MSEKTYNGVAIGGDIEGEMIVSPTMGHKIVVRRLLDAEAYSPEEWAELARDYSVEIQDYVYREVQLHVNDILGSQIVPVFALYGMTPEEIGVRLIKLGWTPTTDMLPNMGDLK